MSLFDRRTDMLTTIRHGLIMWLAGRSTIIINAHLNIAGPITLKAGDLLANTHIVRDALKPLRED